MRAGVGAAEARILVESTLAPARPGLRKPRQRPGK